jgi:hypothetical protein
LNSSDEIIYKGKKYKVLAEYTYFHAIKLVLEEIV